MEFELLEVLRISISGIFGLQAFKLFYKKFKPSSSIKEVNYEQTK